LKVIVITASILIVGIGCKNLTKNSEEVEKLEASKVLGVFGNYVSDDYSKRSEGYDWVAVTVTEIKDDQLNISVRSRADKKRPTCTFDTKAVSAGENTFESIYEGNKSVFQFAEKEMTISTENPEDTNLLYFFCGGGATIAGTYQKINEKLDQEQIDLRAFSRVLNLQDIGFNISSTKKGDETMLSIFTFGLEAQEYNETINIGIEKVVDAEVEDLNSDGSPELFVFTQSPDNNSYGNVYAFSVNNKKSMSPVYFQPTVENEKINKGYKGQDEFTLIETLLAQKFPIYKEGDKEGNPTGGIRQVSYKLIEGEAMRKLEVDKITEY